MKNNLYLLIVALCFFGLPGLAQESKNETGKPSLPDGPLIRDIAPRDSWTITLNSPPGNHRPETATTEGGGTPREQDPIAMSIVQPRQIKISRTDPYVSVLFSSESGKPLAGYYFLRRYVFLQTSRDDRTIRTSFPQRQPHYEMPVGHEFLLAARQNKFYGFDWVSRKTYVGVETIEQTPCFVFENNGTQAYIDQEKRLPVLWKSGDEVRRFKHNGNPPPSHIPEAVLARLEGIKKDYDRLTKSPKGG